jgi:hypothetical protein
LRHESFAIDMQAGHFAQFHAAAGFIGAVAIHGFAADGLIGERRAGKAAYEGDPSHASQYITGFDLDQTPPKGQMPEPWCLWTD